MLHGIDNRIGASFDVRWETTPMREHDGTDEVAAARRRRDVAVILAAGVLRHCREAKKAVMPCPAEPSESAEICLEPSGTSRLSVPAGAGG